MKPFSFGYYLAIEDTGNAVGSDYKEFNIAYDFKLFNFFTSYGDWDAINKVKTFEISKSFSLFDLSISRIMTDNVPPNSVFNLRLVRSSSSLKTILLMVNWFGKSAVTYKPI